MLLRPERPPVPKPKPKKVIQMGLPAWRKIKRSLVETGVAILDRALERQYDEAQRGALSEEEIDEMFSHDIISGLSMIDMADTLGSRFGVVKVVEIEQEWEKEEHN